ncbi:MAG: DUF3000 domain-containing protein [Bifidobacteriaceae bacterium]|jgi:hypothetical protein|nr:DUF3000 domain-containing protein [Bifidobacteriaceae bacterium]
MEKPSSAAPPARFIAALESIRSGDYPRHAALEEIPAPTRAAAFAVALEARVPAGSEDESASGTFVLLHEPGGHVVWDGDFRIVTVAKATLEPELGADPFVAEVSWSYLAEALELESLPRAELAGTVTRTVSESFGALRARGPSVGVEVRASWTPDGPAIGPQLAAWLGFLTQLGGVEPLPPGVSPLRPAGVDQPSLSGLG